MRTHVLQAIILNPNWCDPCTLTITLTGNVTHRCPHRRWGSSCWSRSSAVIPAGSSWVQRLWRPLGHWCTLPGNRPPCMQNEGQASSFPCWQVQEWFILIHWQLSRIVYSDTLAVSRIVYSAAGNFQNSLIRFTVTLSGSRIVYYDSLAGKRIINSDSLAVSIIVHFDTLAVSRIVYFNSLAVSRCWQHQWTAVWR